MVSSNLYTFPLKIASIIRWYYLVYHSGCYGSTHLYYSTVCRWDYRYSSESGCIQYESDHITVYVWCSLISHTVVSWRIWLLSEQEMVANWAVLFDLASLLVSDWHEITNCWWCHHGFHSPFKHYSALLVTSYCTQHRKDGEVDGVTCRVTCTWWRLSLTVKAPWLGQFLPWLHGQA